MSKPQAPAVAHRTLRAHAHCAPAALTQLPLPLGVAPISLDDLLGEQNAPVLAALRAGINQPRALWVHGSQGSGKTHLLRAYAGLLAEHAQSVRLIDAKLGLEPDLLESTLGLDSILIDGVHAWAGPAQAELRLFQLINRHVHDQQKLLVLSANAPALSLPWQLQDLRSRLTQCSSFGLTLLHEDDLVRALRARAAAHGAELDDAVCAWMLSHYSRDPGTLLNMIEPMERAAMAEKRRLTLPFVRSYLRSHAQSGPAASQHA